MTAPSGPPDPAPVTHQHVLDRLRTEAYLREMMCLAALRAGHGLVEYHHHGPGSVAFEVSRHVPPGVRFVVTDVEEWRAYTDEQDALDAARAHLGPDAARLPDEALRSTGTYQRTLVHHLLLELARRLRRSLPRPVRRWLGG